METLETILKRRSIRKFTGEKIKSDDLEKILQAAMCAPSAANVQPWHFIVIDDQAVLAKLAETHRGAAMAKEAGLAILVCADLAVEKFPGYWPQDCAAAVQNLLLAVADLGLGAVWTGIYPREERLEAFKKAMSLPESVMPLAFIPVGYPAETPPPQERYKPEKIHYNHW